jgi:Sulfotransferase family
MALVGHVDEISRRTVIGWAADNENWERQVEVAIFVNGKLVARFPATQYRDGIKGTVAKDATGKYGFEHVFEPPLSSLDEYKIEVKVVGAPQPLPNGSKVLRGPPVMQSPLIPIMVSSAGRSGTTLLMQRLSAYPEVVMGQLYPYEVKLTNYYSAAFRVLAAETDRKNSTDPDTMFGEKFRYVIGSNPFTRLGYHGVTSNRRAIERFFEETVPSALAKTFRELIVDYYHILKQDQNKPYARYFVEKSGLEDVARRGPRILFGNVREIVLIRDPRDFLCSAKSFWKMTSEPAMRLVLQSCKRVEDINQNAGTDTILVKYEDLVSMPVETMERISDFIGVGRLKFSDVEADKSLFGIHATSSSPESSIGRWRNDLNEKEIEFCEQRLRSFMDLFGYTTETAEGEATPSGSGVLTRHEA